MLLIEAFKYGFKDIESAYEASETLERFYGSMSIDEGLQHDGSTPIEFLDHLPEDPRVEGHPQHYGNIVEEPLVLMGI